MNIFIKFIFTIAGGALIGLGLGIMAHKNNLLSAGQFEAAMILSLIAGGFFLALGLPGKRIADSEESSQNAAAREGDRQYPSA
jgi:NhaP-type Na+/H+ or K+/H+ antiporter